jgi:hypothetical protein
LECKLVSSVLSTIDNIEAWNREDIRGRVSSDIGVVLPERNTPGSGSGLTGGKRNCGNER